MAGQERGLRSATENVAGMVGLGPAAEMSVEASRLVALRDRIIDVVAATIPNAYLIGHRYQRLPGYVCLGLAGQEGEAIRLLVALDGAGLAVSTGSARSASHAASLLLFCWRWVLTPFRQRFRSVAAKVFTLSSASSR